MAAISNDWLKEISPEFSKQYYKDLFNFVKEEYSKNVIYPPSEDIFNAFHFTPLSKVKVLLLGQDPYHNENQAHGLSFSVPESQMDIPPSLQNIYKELNTDMGCYIPDNGYLKKWADQGVLLLNASLTVRKDMANSHRNKGWEIFTDEVIKKLNDREKPVIFMLWGNNAKEKRQYINSKRHHMLMSVHPSPLSASRGFFGCNHFKKANELLLNMGEKEIDWQIENI